MTVENDLLEHLKDTLMMTVEGVGPNVFAYDIEKITQDLMPCLALKIDSAENTGASTGNSLYTSVTVTIAIYASRIVRSYTLSEIFKIREKLESVIEASAMPASVIDYGLISASAITADTTNENNVVGQILEYSFLLKETDYAP